MTKRLLIIFVKNIKLGKVKTRLAKSIGDQGAFEVYKDLVEITERETLKIKTNKHIYFSDVIIESKWKNTKKYTQVGSDIGERMENAFLKGFELGYEHIILIGSDLPDINKSIITNGFIELTTKDTVFGPAQDGGYYLVGLKKIPNKIFRNKPWSKSTLLEVTTNSLTADNISFSLLEELNDIDNIEDLNKSTLESKYKT